MTNIDPTTEQKLHNLLAQMRRDDNTDHYRAPQHIETLQNILTPPQNITQLLANGYTENNIRWMYTTYSAQDWIITHILPDEVVTLLNPKTGEALFDKPEHIYPNPHRPKHNPNQSRHNTITDIEVLQRLAENSIIQLKNEYWIKGANGATAEEWHNSTTDEYATTTELNRYGAALFIYQPPQAPF
ncbi:hypothetical protein SEA_PSONYX_61 [Corynebacterium phage PSonyx]|nr:hypothetical protein SEA_PSONYX_61 [Corynebacterium phage PSonyx]